MAVIKPISLAEENGSYDIWKKRFQGKENNFSAWVQSKLLEEEENNHKIDYLISKINTLTLDREKLDNEISILNKQLKKVKEVEEVKIEQAEEVIRSDSTQIEGKIDRIYRRLQRYFETYVKAGYELFSLEMYAKEIIDNYDYESFGHEDTLQFIIDKGYIINNQARVKK